MACVAVEGVAFLLEANDLAAQSEHLLDERPAVMEEHHLEAGQVFGYLSATLLL